MLKAASKAEAVKMKKHQKEMQKWEKGKYAVKSILAKIDTKVVELGSIGGMVFLDPFKFYIFTSFMYSLSLVRLLSWCFLS